MERISNFQYIWSEWIKPLTEDLYNQLDEEFKIKCKVKIKNLTEIEPEAENYYQKKRLQIKKEFYGTYHKGDSIDDHRMDFHKIGAILCRTLIEYKLFDFDIEECDKYAENNISEYNTDWVVKNALINYRLAFYVSVVFLYQSMLFKYSEDERWKNEIICKKLQNKKRLDLYNKNIPIKGNQVHESFENCIVLDLAKRDIGNHSFDFFMYAVILYQLEEHNKNLVLNDYYEETKNITLKDILK